MKSVRKGRETRQLCSGTPFSTAPPIEINSDSYTFKFRCVMFYFVGAAVGKVLTGTRKLMDLAANIMSWKPKIPEVGPS